MNFDQNVTREPARSRAFVILDIESAVIDETGHKRYLAMERWKPDGKAPSRRGYKRGDDPLVCPRWPFQTITTASVMTLIEHVDGNTDVAAFDTYSAPDLNEREVTVGVIKSLAAAPTGAELVTFAGMMHDIPMCTLAAMRHGLTLPPAWRWLAFGGADRARHLDFARIMSGGMKMKPVHMAELLASLDIPAKISAPAFAMARHIYAGNWDLVQEGCEGDVISTALMLARWRGLIDPRAPMEAVEDRILRRIVELRPNRSYTKTLQARQGRKFARLLMEAANDMATLAPWLEEDAA
jgi:3'-5' exonuclease